MTECCKSVFGRLTQTASWGLFALQSVTVGDAFDTSMSCLATNDEASGRRQWANAERAIIESGQSWRASLELGDPAHTLRIHDAFEFLAELQGMETKNFALEAMRKLINGEIHSRRRIDVSRTRTFYEWLEEAIVGDNTIAITTAEVILELIELAKDICAAHRIFGVFLSHGEEAHNGVFALLRINSKWEPHRGLTAFTWELCPKSHHGGANPVALARGQASRAG